MKPNYSTSEQYPEELYSNEMEERLEMVNLPSGEITEICCWSNDPNDFYSGSHSGANNGGSTSGGGGGSGAGTSTGDPNDGIGGGYNRSETIL